MRAEANRFGGLQERPLHGQRLPTLEDRQIANDEIVGHFYKIPSIDAFGTNALRKFPPRTSSCSKGLDVFTACHPRVPDVRLTSFSFWGFSLWLFSFLLGCCVPLVRH